MALVRSACAGAAEHVIPRYVASVGGNGDGARQREKVGGPSQNGSFAFDPEDHVVALSKTEGITHRLGNSDLTLRADFGGNFQCILLTRWTT